MDGIRNNEMGDYGVMVILCRRFGSKALLWDPPALEALDELGTRNRVFRHQECAPAGIPARPATLFMLHTNVGMEHFEPVLPNDGTTARASRFTAVGDRLPAEDFCPVLNLRYTSNAARRRVRSLSLVND